MTKVNSKAKAVKATAAPAVKAVKATAAPAVKAVKAPKAPKETKVAKVTLVSIGTAIFDKLLPDFNTGKITYHALRQGTTRGIDEFASANPAFAGGINSAASTYNTILRKCKAAGNFKGATPAEARAKMPPKVPKVPKVKAVKAEPAAKVAKVAKTVDMRNTDSTKATEATA